MLFVMPLMQNLNERKGGVEMKKGPGKVSRAFCGRVDLAS
jgi:hypothetical protein